MSSTTAKAGALVSIAEVIGPGNWRRADISRRRGNPPGRPAV